MDIAVLGTGIVGRTVAARLADLGHRVVIGTRDVAGTLARTEPDAMGNPAYPVWAAGYPAVGLATFADAAAGAQVLVNASSGDASLDVLRLAGAANLADKVLIDIANPLDFSAGFPPSLSVANTDSLAERIQREFPRARVVKALNTVTAALMVDPGAVGGGDHSAFVSGDDPAARATVVALLTELGWRDIIELGDLSTARGTEMLLPLWLRLMGALDTPMFGIKVVR